MERDKFENFRGDSDMKRVCLLILDSVGIGELPDAARFGDAGAHTLGNINIASGGLKLPNLFAMGLGNIENSRLPKVPAPTAAYGRCVQKTYAKDTTSGHWEIAGVIMEQPFRTYPEGFPQEIIAEYERLIGRRTLANIAASGTEIINRCGEEHILTGFPIVYTSADSVFQVAAHEDVIPVEQLYKFCEAARKLMMGEHTVGRVIARPFIGPAGNFKRTERRRDYTVAPVAPTILTAIESAGLTTLGIGKIKDIFSGVGVTHSNHTTNNNDGVDATISALNNPRDALIFVNLIDFDMLYGHRNDPAGYAAALEHFDIRLPEITSSMSDDDILIITADHGCDPTTASTDHTREYIPLLVYGAHISPVSLGTRTSFADIGATVCKWLGVEWGIGEPVL